MDKIRQAIEEKRLIFFNNGKYKYIPTTQAQKKIEEVKKPFDSQRANKIHEIKIMNRKKIWQEANRRLEKIENHIDKGLKRIQNKEFIYN